MENTENIYNEAVLGMLSEINKKLDAIQANSKIKEIQPVNQEINPTVSKEEIELITRSAFRKTERRSCSQSIK